MNAEGEKTGERPLLARQKVKGASGPHDGRALGAGRSYTLPEDRQQRGISLASARQLERAGRVKSVGRDFSRTMQPFVDEAQRKLILRAARESAADRTPPR